MTDWEKKLFTHEEGNFLQSEQWAKVAKLTGDNPIMAVIKDNSICSMLIRNAKRGRYIEIPGGPLIDWNDKTEIKLTIEKIKEIAKSHHCVFVRLRPQLEKNEKNMRILKSIGAKPAKMHLAAEHTIILDLEKSEETLLKEMRRQTRYEIRRAEKLGIKVEKSNSIEIFKEFYKVQSETAKRQNFIPPNLKTLMAERESFGDKIHIYVAKTGEHTELKGKTYDPNQPIAYGLVLSNGVEAEYFEAASTELNHDLPGAYALQMAIIRDLKKQGLKHYNLWGIAPPNSPNHRYAKVTTFKKGFGGKVVEYVPAHDIVLNRFKYLPNYIIETIRKKRRNL